MLSRSSVSGQGHNDLIALLSFKSRSSGGQRYKRVWRWLVAAPAHRVTLARCTWASRIQAERHDVQLHAQPNSTVPDGFLPCDLQHRITATTSICWADVPRCRLSTTARRALSLVGPSVWNSIPDYLRDSGVSKQSLINIITGHKGLFSHLYMPNTKKRKQTIQSK